MSGKKEKKGLWVVIGGKPGEVGHCTRCGQGLTVSLPQPLYIMAACMKAFAEHHEKCEPGKYVEKPTKTPAEWADGRDTGTSSLTIYAAMTGMSNPHEYHAPPRDPSDFGRCYRLLKLFPSWRERLDSVSAICPEFKPFIENWDKLTQMYEDELAKKIAPGTMYDFMQTLEDEDVTA